MADGITLSGGAPRSMPELGQRVSSPFAGLQTGPWSRWVDAKWLGSYTPANVQHWVRKLMRRDPQIKLGLMALKAPFFGIDYRVEGGNARTRAFVNKVLLETPMWKKLIWSILNAIDFGFQCHELVWDIDDVALDYTDDEGQKKQINTTLQKAFVLKILADIDPERVYPLVDLHGDLEGVSVDGLRFVPMEKLLHAVNQYEWKNHWGTAHVDSSYIPWYHNNFYYLFLARYLESKGNPVLKGTAPWESRFVDNVSISGQTEVRAAAYLASQAIALQGGSVAILPWEPDANGNNQWSLEELEVSQRTELFLPIIQHNESMKLRGVLVPERVATQDSSVGSYASSDVHLDVFYGIMEVFKDFLILGTINDGIIPKLIRYNFGKSAPVPRVNASELNRDSKQLLGEIIKASLTVPQRLKNGQVWSLAEVIDGIHALESMNIPHHKPEDVAHDEDPLLMPGVPRAAAPPPRAGAAKGLHMGAMLGSPDQPRSSDGKFGSGMGGDLSHHEKEAAKVALWDLASKEGYKTKFGGPDVTGYLAKHGLTTKTFYKSELARKLSKSSLAIQGTPKFSDPSLPEAEQREDVEGPPLVSPVGSYSQRLGIPSESFALCMQLAAENARGAMRIEQLMRDVSKPQAPPAPAPTPIVINMPERQTVVQNTVEAPAAPSVVNNVTVPERAVTVQNDVSVPERSVTVNAGDVAVATPAVNVQVSAPSSPGKSVTFTKDGAGRITGAEIAPKDGA